MAKFDIEVDVCMGSMCYGGAIYESGDGFVELNDEEVQQLVALIKEHKSSDVEELDIENALPVVYEKLSKACHDVAYRANALHYLNNAWYEGEPDVTSLIEYCEANCGYHYDAPHSNDYVLEEDAEAAIIDYLRNLSDCCSITFTRNGANLEVENENGEITHVNFPRGDEDEETLLGAESEDFHDWLCDYLHETDFDTLHTIYLDYLGFDPSVFDLDEDSYHVTIPDAIVKMAKLKK